MHIMLNKGDKRNWEMKCDKTSKFNPLTRRCEWVTEYGKCPETGKRQNPF